VRPVPSGILSERGNESRETRNPFYSAKRLDVGEFILSMNTFRALRESRVTRVRERL